MPERCYIISGLVVSSLEEDNEISLPPTYTNTRSLPNVIKEIPSPEDISSIPGVSHLAKKFPKKQDWPTILLIGRDCMLAQTQDHLTWSDDQSQVAAKTPLGWVLIGSPATSKPNPKTPHSHPQHPYSQQHLRQSSSFKATSKTDPNNQQAQSIANQYTLESDQLARSIKGRKEDELPGYSQDEKSFLEMVISGAKQRPDKMIELPLPFKEDNPKFSFKRTTALKRTTSERRGAL